MKRFLLIFIAFTQVIGIQAEVTLEECLRLAEENYPLIKRYSLVEETAAIQLSDINKGWLPRINLYAQGTVQNAVPSFPEALTGIMSQMGRNVEGLDKWQYKLGLDVNQTIWDGGASKRSREIERLSAEEQKAHLDVRMYSIKERVEDLYFGILLLEARVESMDSSKAVLEENLERMCAMQKDGVAMRSDVEMLKARYLSVEQTQTESCSAVEAYRSMLSLFTGKELSSEILAIPEAIVPVELENNRPELILYQQQLRLNENRRKLADTALMPHIGFFAQAYYGYPGFNYFKSMMSREISLNALAGLKVSWNIDAFYKRANVRAKTVLADMNVENENDLFLFNSNLQAEAAKREIEGLRKVCSTDEEIVNLRIDVRRAAESQLRNGVIDATALLTKIDDETQARLTASYHHIKLVQQIYKLKYILNR